MGFRARKSLKIAPGVRMTVTPRGVGISVGVAGARVSAHSSGRITRTVGIPGSGLSHVTTAGGASGGRPTGTGASGSGAPPRRPGLLAPRWEKDLYQAVTTADFQALQPIAAADERARRTCMFVDAIMYAHASGQVRRALSIAEQLWVEGYSPSTDPFLLKYFPGAMIQVGLAEGVSATVPCDRDSLGLVLAELRQELGDAAGAVAIVEQLTPTTLTAVSLAELYSQQHRWGEVVELTDGVANEDDFTCFLLIQRGIAFREQGWCEAARDCLRAAYSARGREPLLRRLALMERGRTYLAEGKRSMARRDFEKVMAEDADYPGLAGLLASVGR